MTFRILNGLCDGDCGLELTRAHCITTRGHAEKLYKQHSRTNRGKYSFSHRVVDPWNALPASVIEAKSINSFKSRLDIHMENLGLTYNSMILIDKMR